MMEEGLEGESKEQKLRDKVMKRLRNRSEPNLAKIDENSESVSDVELSETWPQSKSLISPAVEKSDSSLNLSQDHLTPGYKPRPKSTSFSSVQPPSVGTRTRRKNAVGSLGPNLQPISATQSCFDVSATSMSPSSSTYNIDAVGKHKNDKFSKSTPQLYSMGYDMKNKEGPLNGKIKSDLGGKRSISSPVMNTDASRSFEDLATEDDDTFASNSINKKFHKLFKNVPQDERVLDRYSCALFSDILLQGQIYITDNYFAFYSNVLFGHVTRVVIPVPIVTDIRKVKMVKVIPNAVKIVTPNKKFTFGSLLSRETTYKLMYKVWKRQKQERDSVSQTSSERVSAPSEIDEEPDDGTAGSLNTSSIVEGEANERVLPLAFNSNSVESNIDQTDSKSSSQEPLTEKTGETKPSFILGMLDTLSPVHWLKTRLKASVNILNRLPRTTVFLAMCTVVLIFLYASAAFLIYRLNMLYGHIGGPDATVTEERYQNVFTYKTHLHSASISQLQDALNTQIQELVDVRKSLETLRLVTAASIQPEETFQKSNADSVLKK